MFSYDTTKFIENISQLNQECVGGGVGFLGGGKREEFGGKQLYELVISRLIIFFGNKKSIYLVPFW